MTRIIGFGGGIVRRLSLIFALALAGCVARTPAETPEGIGIEIVKAAPEGCLELGELSASAGSEDDAEQDVRRKAGRMGATHLVIEKPASNSNGVTVTAAAYSCG